MERGNGKWIIWLIAGVLALFVLVASWPFAFIDQSERGVVKINGAVTEVLQPGFHLITPFITDVTRVNIQEQKEQVEANSASKDLQTVKTVVAVTYKVVEGKEIELVSTVGLNGYKSVLIDPAIQEAVKAATAQYTAEELITKRPQVKEDIQRDLIAQINSTLISIRTVSIVDFDFSPSFNAAIEAKVTAEQNALAAKNKLEQVKFEAEQQVATAEATAKSIRLQSDAANNEKYVNLKKIEVDLEFAKHWDGIYPSTYIVNGGSGSGNSMPLVIPLPNTR